MKKSVFMFSAAILVLCLQSPIMQQEPANKQELGKLLFFDPILSADSSISCASCHNPRYAFADSTATSRGVGGLAGRRNTPSAMNLAMQQIFFWDGRAKSLEEQALAPIENPQEMNLPLEKAMQRLRENAAYNKYFQKVFNREPDATGLAEALAAFERSLETAESPFDLWKFHRDPDAVSDAVKRGFVLFNNKAKCVQCHFGSNFARDEFRNIGLFNGRDLDDSGRAAITHDRQDLGKFKIAPLRNVAVTAPYMHNGMFKTLKEVITFYNDPGKIVPDAINRDSLMATPLGLTEQEQADLEAFLIALTDKTFAGGKK